MLGFFGDPSTSVASGVSGGEALFAECHSGFIGVGDDSQKLIDAEI